MGEQCQFFLWTMNPVVAFCHMAKAPEYGYVTPPPQPTCTHPITSMAGSNAFVKIVTCRVCKAILSRERKTVVTTVTTERGPVSPPCANHEDPGVGSEQAASDLTKIHEILQVERLLRKEFEMPLQEIDSFLSKCVAEVYSEPRLTKRTGRHRVRAGRAFDLKLGDNFLEEPQREKCLEHLRRKRYGLVTLTPPCTLFSMLRFLGPHSHERLQSDEYQQRRKDAETLLSFAVDIARLQHDIGAFFLLEHLGLRTAGRR
jgi:hypothetical protein